MTGVAKVWRWLNQPRVGRMVLMPTACPAPTTVPTSMFQGRAFGSGRILAAVPAVNSYFHLYPAVMAGVPGQGAPALCQHNDLCKCQNFWELSSGGGWAAASPMAQPPWNVHALASIVGPSSHLSQYPTTTHTCSRLLYPWFSLGWHLPKGCIFSVLVMCFVSQLKLAPPVLDLILFLTSSLPPSPLRLWPLRPGGTMTSVTWISEFPPGGTLSSCESHFQVSHSGGFHFWMSLRVGKQ